LPQARLALETTVAVCATIVAILASVRFLVEGRVLDVVLSGGFLTAGLGTLAFEVAPTLGGSQLTPVESWAGIGAQLAAAALVALAPFPRWRVGSRPYVLTIAAVTTALILVGTVFTVVLAHPGPGIEPGGRHSFPLTLAYAVSALFGVIAMVGFGLRYRAHG